MDLIGTIFGVSFASGLNFHATVLAMGELNRLGILHLPPNLDVIASIPVMVVAAVLYGVEFVVDKVPYVSDLSRNYWTPGRWRPDSPGRMRVPLVTFMKPCLQRVLSQVDE
jgi:Domain of unknown function (DUF4126)